MRCPTPEEWVRVLASVLLLLPGGREDVVGPRGSAILGLSLLGHLVGVGEGAPST